MLATDGGSTACVDSKMLSEARREELFDRVAERCAGWAWSATPGREKSDELGMSAALGGCTSGALDALNLPVGAVLLDGKVDFVGHENTTMLNKGDACRSIATASILAKVSRDRMMRAAAADHPATTLNTTRATSVPTSPTCPARLRPDCDPPAQLVVLRRSTTWPGQRYVRPDPQLSLFG